ncbi:hypothetical protein D8B26_005656 [Coccidioides posadasii str. Silveira]|uniref:DUF1690 domain-containing protein n=2 Tax=Coccidioides posadasii TaxID=199306 RepID=E9D586_COCPS|nr:DUF1690 domain-containing protein [Coccidioides posadasii str. Silveira]KMM66844.1 hypothetical protein CPAG_03181 [Coccidioides posadasii RMSCC 3488]QVM11005.1 hypothetical protein D8B26_005656 [Coccidioides posadasii str. Silveira]
MGAGGSKLSETSGGSRHVFRSETPVQFSQNLVESLQSSSETDSSRAQTIELHIQNRVAEELKRIQARETQTLADLEQRLAETTQSSAFTDQSTSLDAPRVPFAGPETAGFPQDLDQDAARRELSSQQVALEIEALREKLAARRKVKEVDAGVEKAREDVVNCLRGKEKRPLDCWAEVDTFKKEVARLEKDWVKKVIG